MPRKRVKRVSHSTHSTSKWHTGEVFADLDIRTHIVHLQNGTAQFMIVITAPSGAVAEDVAQIYQTAFAKKSG